MGVSQDSHPSRRPSYSHAARSIRSHTDQSVSTIRPSCSPLGSGHVIIKTLVPSSATGTTYVAFDYHDRLRSLNHFWGARGVIERKDLHYSRKKERWKTILSGSCIRRPITHLKRGCTELAPPREYLSHFLAFFAAYQTFLSWNPLPGTSRSCLHHSIMYPNLSVQKLSPKRCCMRLYAALSLASQLKFDARNAVRLTVYITRSSSFQMILLHPVRSWAEFVLIKQIPKLKDFVVLFGAGMVTIFLR